MIDDPIVAEIHKVREEILAAFDDDLNAYMDYLQEIEAEKRKRGVQYVDPPARPARPPKPNAA